MHFFVKYLWAYALFAKLSKIQISISRKISIMLLLMTTTHAAFFLQYFVFKAIYVSTVDVLDAGHPCKYNSAKLSKYHTKNLGM